MKYYVTLLVTVLFMCSCRKPDNSLDSEAGNLEAQMKGMAYYAPTLKAFELRVDSIKSKTGQWPKNSDELFAPGSIDVRYPVDGVIQLRTWSKDSFKIEVLEWKNGRPVYKLKFAGHEREMEM